MVLHSVWYFKNKVAMKFRVGGSWKIIRKRCFLSNHTLTSWVTTNQKDTRGERGDLWVLPSTTPYTHIKPVSPPNRMPVSGNSNRVSQLFKTQTQQSPLSHLFPHPNINTTATTSSSTSRTYYESSNFSVANVTTLTQTTTISCFCKRLLMYFASFHSCPQNGLSKTLNENLLIFLLRNF